MYYVFCIFECLRAPGKMGKCSLGLPSLNKDFIIIIFIIVTERPSLRQTRQLAFIVEFTTDIRYVKGETNFVADAL